MYYVVYLLFITLFINNVFLNQLYFFSALNDFHKLMISILRGAFKIVSPKFLDIETRKIMCNVGSSCIQGKLYKINP